MKFKEIEIGKSEQIRALLTGIEERGAKAGTRYLVLNFTDGEQTVTANYWNCTRYLILGSMPNSIRAVPHIPSSLIC